MANLNDIAEIVSRVDGWLTLEEGRLLYRLAQRCPAEAAIVEVGSFKGKSTIWLASGAAAGNRCKVYAIDPHTGSIPDKRRGEVLWTFDAFKQNVEKAGVSHLIDPILATSEEAIRTFDEPVGLIFIDGEHEYPFVQRDARQWVEKVIPGGVMSFHDTMASCTNLFRRPFLPGWDGPNRVFAEQCLNSPAFSGFGHAGTISYAVKAPVDARDWKRHRLAYRRATRGRRTVTRIVTGMRAIGPLAWTVRRVKAVLGRT